MFEFMAVKYQEILDIPELTIDAGITTAIVGASGSGKTTLLRLMNKMISPTSGRILYKNTDLNEISSVAHRRKVLMLSQNALITDGSVADNLEMGFRLRGEAVPTSEHLTQVLLDVQLDKSLTANAAKLSGGEKQRLALARVLLLNPDVYLLDEPSSALDSETETEVIEMLVCHARDRGKSIVMVTHAIHIAQAYAQTVIELGKGRIQKRQVGV